MVGFLSQGAQCCRPFGLWFPVDSAAARVEPGGKQTSRSGQQRPQALLRDSLHRCLGRAQGLELRGSHFGKQSSGNVLFQKQKLNLPKSPLPPSPTPSLAVLGNIPAKVDRDTEKLK